MLTIKLQDFVYIVIHFFPNISNVKNICTAKSLSRVGKRCLGIQSRMIPMYHLSSFTSTLPHKKILHSRENKRNKTFLRKMGIPGLFFYYFWSFQTNNTIFTTKQCEKCPNINLVYGAEIRTHDLLNVNHHPLPLDHGCRPKQNFVIQIVQTKCQTL